jgi:hypothetical protein
VHFNRLEAPIKAMAYQDMIEHLRLAVVQNAPTSGPRDPAIENNEGTP